MKNIFLTEILNDYYVTVGILKASLTACSVKASGKKVDLIKAVEKFFLNTPIEKLLTIFSKEEVCAFAEAAHNNYEVNAQNFHCKYEFEFPVKKYTGKIFNLTFNRIEGGGREGVIYIFAKDFIDRIKHSLENPNKARTTYIDNIPKFYESVCDGIKRDIKIFSGEETALLEMLEFLRLIHSKNLKMTPKTQMPTAGAVKTSYEALIVEDINVTSPIEDQEDSLETIRPYALIHLAIQCKWASLDAKNIVRITKKGSIFLSSESIEDYKEGVLRYFKSNQFDEFHRIDHIKGQQGKGRRKLTSPMTRRLDIIEALKLLDNKWLGFDDCFKFIFKHGFGFEVTRNLWHLYFSEREYGSLGDSGDAEVGVKKQYLRVLLMEYMATLGMIDIAYVYPHDLWPEMGDYWGVDDYYYCSGYDGLLYIKLNKLGAYILGIKNTYNKAASINEPLHVLPTEEIIVSKKISILDKLFLNKFANHLADLTWKIDDKKTSLYLENGGSIEKIVHFLEVRSKNSLPKLLLDGFKTINNKVVSVDVITNCIALTLNNKEIALTLSLENSTKKYCALVQKNKLYIASSDVRNFYKAVKKLGYSIPLLSEQYDLK